MKLTILGGGGFRVPLVYEAVAAAASRVPVTEVVLLDDDAGRLATMSHLLAQLRAELGAGPAVRTTGDLDDAVREADVVFSAIRVGGTTGRTRDERVALAEAVLGQETVGPGGLAYALRTVPVAEQAARRIAALAPSAWTINFTNPASVVTEAMTAHLGERVVGICDTPIALVRRTLRAAGQDPAAFDHGEVAVDYAGLNHLGWLLALHAGDKDLLPDLLADDAALNGLEEARLMGADWVRALGALPNEYQYYYDFARESLAGIQAQDRTRGEYLAEQQQAFYTAAAAEPHRALPLWRAALADREATYMAAERDTAGAGERAEEDLGGGYHQVAVDLMAALLGGEEHRMILDVLNTDGGRPVLPGLPTDAVVEVPVRVNRSGVQPLRQRTGLDPAMLARVQTVKACERLILDAARTGSSTSAWRAFAAHPLVDSVAVARRLVAAYLG